MLKNLRNLEVMLLQIATLYIPHIHCSSCIWILENLNKLNPNISDSQVNFGKKTVRVTYNSTETNLKDVVILIKFHWL